MSTLQATNLKHASSASNNIVLDSSGNATFAGTPVPNSSFLRNRIINGDMRIDQRNAGASGTANQYTVDRFAYFGAAASKGTWQQNAGSVTPPAGFTNYWGFTSSSAYTVGATEQFNLYQPVEGFNVSDLAWGTANAKTVTLSFWVRSSLTGTFGGSIYNSAVNRSYPYSYTISSANTWEYKTITVSGDTSGTWLTTNGVGLYLNFSLGAGSTVSGTAGAWAATRYDSATGATSVVGTNGATFYITGVQLEVGTAATPFERRQYGQELALCQRYYEKSYDTTVAPGSATVTGSTFVIGNGTTSSNQGNTIAFAAEKRATPTISYWDSAGNPSKVSYYDSSAARTDNQTQAAPTYTIGTRNVTFRYSNGIAGAVCIAYQWTAAAEL
jgi:hypothetical protein